MEPETDNQARPGQASLGSEQPGNAYAINKLQDKSYLNNPLPLSHPPPLQHSALPLPGKSAWQAHHNATRAVCRVQTTASGPDDTVRYTRYIWYLYVL